MNTFRKHQKVVFQGLSVCSFLAFASGCRPGRNFYVIEEIRVPAMQILQKVDAPVTGGHCFDYAGETVCQQYPLRPAKKFHFRMLALAPAGSQPVKIRFTKLQQTRLAVPPTQGNLSELTCDSLTVEDIPLSRLGLPEDFLTATVKQETPMRVEEHTVSFTTPAQTVFESELAASGALPLFRLEYEATSGQLRTDKGALTFSILSEAQSTAATNASRSSAAAGCLTALQSGVPAATTTKPPSITALSPAQGEVVGGSPLELRMTLGDEANSSARRRIQWYISRGELNNQRAASTELTFSGSEPLTAVGIVRDLQGGVDFAWSTFSARP